MRQKAPHQGNPCKPYGEANYFERDDAQRYESVRGGSVPDSAALKLWESKAVWDAYDYTLGGPVVVSIRAALRNMIPGGYARMATQEKLGEGDHKTNKLHKAIVWVTKRNDDELEKPPETRIFLGKFKRREYALQACDLLHIKRYLCELANNVLPPSNQKLIPTLNFRPECYARWLEQPDVASIGIWV